MSRRLARHGRSAAADGFSLVEVLVALSIFAVAAAALIPLLLVSVKAAGTARLETQAKNLVQQQVERMRNLTFHVAHQNGDYVDLLDLYYTDTNATAKTLTPTSTPRNSVPYQDADGNVVVQYLANAGGTGGRPSGAAYRVSGLQFAGYQGFSLEVFTQFLQTTRSVTVPASTYDSQADTADAPPAQLVGVTVISTWTGSSGSQTYRTYTEMADGRGTGALLTTQSRSTAIRITGSDTTGNNLLVQAGVVQADGSVTSGSTATVAAEAARLEQVGTETQLGQAASTTAPPNPSGTVGVSATVQAKTISGATANLCGWGSVGSTQVADVTATTGVQQPLIPYDGGTDVRASSKRVQAGVLTGGSGCAGYNVAFRPDADALWTPAVGYGIDASQPLIGIPDTSGSGLSNAAVRASGQVAASQIVTAPIFSSAYASARTKPVRILPVTGYVEGLVRAELKSSSVTCVSGQSPAAAYELEVAYPGGTRTVRFTDASPSLPDPATISFMVDGVPRTLSEYLSWSVATSLSDGANGVTTFGPVLRVTINKAVLGTTTDATVELGVLSCVADDRR